VCGQKTSTNTKKDKRGSKLKVKRTYLNRLPLILLILVVFEGKGLVIKAEIVDRIVAIVNDEVITLSELKKSAKFFLIKDSNKSDSKDFERKLLEEMVINKLLDQEARKKGISVDDEQINIAIREILKKSNTSVDEFKKMLKKKDIGWDEYREMIKEQLIRYQLINIEVNSHVTITEEDIKQYYETHMRDSEVHSDRVRIQQILLVIPPDATQEKEKQIMEKAEWIRKKLLEGEDFSEFARKYSQDPSADSDGDLGYFAKGELRPEIEKVVFSMKAGEISPVIRSSVGYHIIKLLDYQKATSEEGWQLRKKEIEDVLFNIKAKERYQTWLEDLKKHSYIEIKL